jgi:hypothetical protein
MRHKQGGSEAMDRILTSGSKYSPRPPVEPLCFVSKARTVISASLPEGSDQRSYTAATSGRALAYAVNQPRMAGDKHTTLHILIRTSQCHDRASIFMRRANARQGRIRDQTALKRLLREDKQKRSSEFTRSPFHFAPLMAKKDAKRLQVCFSVAVPW